MINLLYCGNKGVFDGVLTSLLSILKRSKEDRYHVFLFTMDLTSLKPTYEPISQKEVSFLEDVLKSYSPESVVELIDVTDLYQKHFAGCPNESAYCSPYTLIRLFADLIPSIPDKLLYLDADIMFNRDIHLLYEQDVSDVEYAAARDHYGKFLVNPNYVNAGVLLFNIKKDKETKLFEKSRAWIQKKKLVFADQSALIRSTTSKKMLPQRFNDQKFLHPSTVVRHFSKRLFYLPYPHTANIKQWNVEGIHKIFHYHQFDDILNEYLELKKKFEAQ